jgi:glycosyltransferase involved in cell wall biosynthesis
LKLFRSPNRADARIALVGHPSAPIGMGEHVRSVYKAFVEAGEIPSIVDIYGPTEEADQQLISTYRHALSDNLSDSLNIFCINGDEVELAFSVLAERNLLKDGSRNVIYPAWELENYPDEWAAILDRFDEVWAPSLFIAQSIEKSVNVPVIHMPLACEIGKRALLSRRSFGIRESAYCFFSSFDFRSYIERKNPFAALESFALMLDKYPKADANLVVKVNNSKAKPERMKQFLEYLDPFKDRVTLLDQTFSDLEMKSLMGHIDCYVSLHRSEGFGRGMSEAMALAKPVLATAYSGNMDFCNEETAYLVPYNLISVLKSALGGPRRQLCSPSDGQAGDGSSDWNRGRKACQIQFGGKFQLFGSRVGLC